MIPKIALSQICSPKEDPQQVKRMLESVFPFISGVFVTISYDKSKKEIPSKLKKTYKETCAKYGIPCHISYGNFLETISEEDVKAFEHQYSWKPEFKAGDKVFIFCDARNHNLKQIPQDEYPYFLWIDTDDTFRGGEYLGDIVAKMVERQIPAVYFNYLYLVDFDEKGNVKHVKVEHLRERVIKNDGTFKWVGPLHETLIEGRQTARAIEHSCDVLHMVDEEKCLKSVERNVRVLEWCMMQPQYRNDPRYMMSLAKAYYDKQRFDEAEKLLYDYLDKSGWAEERSHAWNYLSAIYRLRKEFNKSIKAAANAQIEDPANIEAYLSQGFAYLHKGEPIKAKRLLDCALSAKVEKSTLVTNPKDMQARALEILYQWALHVGNIEEADRAIKQYQTLFPDDLGMAARAKALEELKVEKKVNIATMDLIRYYELSGDKHRGKTFAYALPFISLKNPTITEWRNKILPPRVWKDNEIAIFCGPGFEPWSPKSIERGIGGSEEAVIHLSKELVKQGWEVTVFADPDEEAGDYDGAHYRPYFECNWQDEFNILVAWRNVGILDIQPIAKAIYVWLHDVQVDQEYTKERQERITKVIPLSAYHRNFIPNVPDEKVMVSANGVDMELTEKVLKKNLKRDPHKCVWTSSYDRGLEHLLKMWPRIREEVPDTTLEIMYGWNLFLSFYRNNPERMNWHSKMSELMKQPGITHHGRVSHEEVTDWMTKSAVFAYSSHFEEISCISAQRAQIVGAIPVVTSIESALGETVQHGIKIAGDIWDKEVQDKYVKELVELLKDEKKQEKIRKPMMAWAKDAFTWTKVARQFSEEFWKVVNR